MTTYLLITKASPRECWASAKIIYPEGAVTCVARAEADLAAVTKSHPNAYRGRIRTEARMQTQKSYQGMSPNAKTYCAPTAAELEANK